MFLYSHHQPEILRDGTFAATGAIRENQHAGGEVEDRTTRFNAVANSDAHWLEISIENADEFFSGRSRTTSVSIDLKDRAEIEALRNLCNFALGDLDEALERLRKFELAESGL